jgi:hypothetical protein
MTINENSFILKYMIIKTFLGARMENEITFWEITTKLEIGILQKFVYLEANIKPTIIVIVLAVKVYL